MEQVFVYGTLKPGGYYWPKFCEGKVSEVVPAKARGQMYHLRVGYPGLLLRGREWVHGCILSFPNPADFIEIDRLEGFDPSRSADNNEYNRVKVQCFDLNNEPLGSFWTYTMSEDRIRKLGGTFIETGVWEVRSGNR